MDKEIIELIDNIKLKKQQVQNLVNENKLNEAKKVKEELIQLQNKFDLLYDLEDNKEDNIKNNIENISKISGNKITEEEAFIQVIKNVVLNTPVPSNVLNALKTSGEEGMLVPEDISTTIIGLRRKTQSLENLVNVEKVEKTEGSRVVEKMLI